MNFKEQLFFPHVFEPKTIQINFKIMTSYIYMGLFKNAQDLILRPLGSREIARNKCFPLTGPRDRPRDGTDTS